MQIKKFLIMYFIYVYLVDGNKFCNKVLDEAIKRDIVPNIPKLENTPIPAIHKIEWDLTFHCNDYCNHCVTDSGPKCKEFTTINDSYKIIENIQRYNLLSRIKELYNGKAEFEFSSSSILEKLEKMKKPPTQLNDKLSRSYLECLHGTNYQTLLKVKNSEKKLNFGRPHIRLSGGEFFTWPNNDMKIEKRLKAQTKFLKKIREKLPDYDIWILTNGRFASSENYSDEVINFWSKNLEIEDKKTGKTRICISTDPFHSPPIDSTINDMLKRIWRSCKKYNFSAPFLYGIHGKEIYYAGRAFDKFNLGRLNKLKNKSKSDFNPPKNYRVTTKDLIESDGCNELKGFFVKIKNNAFIPVNNININPSGHLTFCCAQVGDYGDFVNHPENTLKNIIINPISFILRRKKTAIPFLNLAYKMDSEIEIPKNVENAAVVSSTCYQMLSGKRKNY